MSEPTTETSETRAPQQKPLDLPMVPLALGGMAVFALAGVGLLIARPWLVDTGREQWLWICLAGLLWGIPGWLFMVGHDRRRRRRQETTADQPTRSGNDAA